MKLSAKLHHRGRIRSIAAPGRFNPTEWRSHRFFCRVGVTLCLLTAGCGFEPLMARNTSYSVDELSRIRVLTIADRSGQILRNHLLDDLVAQRDAGPPLYALEVTISEPQQEIAIRRDESASRVFYSANANFVLRDNEGRPLMRGTSTSSSTFEATTSEFASIAGQRSARDRAMQELSADIRQQLAAYFSRTRPK